MTLSALGIFSAAGAGGAILSGVAGYFAGGNSGGKTSKVEKIAFPSDTNSVLGTGMSEARQLLAGMANAGVAGYCAGDSAGSSSVDKFAFPSDSRTTLATGLSANSGYNSAFSNSGTAGYFVAGFNGSSIIGTINKFAFPSDTRSTLSNLDPARFVLSGMANKGVAGYASGGDTETNDASAVNTVTKFAFPADTRSNLGTGLSVAVGYSASMANSGTAGYVGGGVNTSGSAQTVINKFAFPSDTRSTLATGFSVGRIGNGMANSNFAGYFAGFGDRDVEKFAFPSDTRSVIANGISASTSNKPAGFANEAI
jgi:hypothetical protein